MPALRPALTHPAAVAQPAIEELEDLDVVARRRHVRVGRDDQRRHLQAADRVAEVELLAQALADLVEQSREVLGSRRDALVQLVTSACP